MQKENVNKQLWHSPTMRGQKHLQMHGERECLWYFVSPAIFQKKRHLSLDWSNMDNIDDEV
jgi:hypothetical protein